MNRPTIVLVLSIAVLPAAVKAQDGNLPSFKKDGTQHESGFKDSVKDVQNDFSKLIQTLIISGNDFTFADGFAQAVGLSQPMPAKVAHTDISRHEDKEDSRECNIVYGPDGNSGRHAVCVLLSRSKYTKGTMSDKYYRVNLDGQLENAVTLNVKRGVDGKGLPEGRSRSEEDIAAPDTQKAFNAEMAYWLKDWLKKQRNAKTASAKLAEPAVREHAEAAHQAVEQEAAAAPAASASAPTTP